MTNTRVTKEDALHFHAKDKPGKLGIVATKPLTTQHDLSLAYSPGVAFPCEEIAKDPLKAYEYTSKGNMVAVISNGTAVLGLGNLGAIASKPVMEGKSVLFKKFADVDSIDLEVNTEDIDKFVSAVELLAPSFGGINLEDIKSPECFIIEKKLREKLDIPVFHDDQHGTAIITAAAFFNALDLTGRDIKDVKLVSSGAGAASIACIELLKSSGLPHENVTLVDREGVIYKGRKSGMNEWKTKHAVKTTARTLADAMKGADVFLGLSVKDAVSKDMVKSMAKKPIVFAMANPDPEIKPEDVKKVRSDAIIATGRSDYPNQVNNVLGFPYIFRGALDVRAKKINDEMKIAAAKAIAKLARENVPDEVHRAYAGRAMSYGPEYIIPVPFDPRLIVRVPAAVAKAAMETGVAQRPIENMEEYQKELASRLDSTASYLETAIEAVQASPKTIIFAEGEQEKSIRAAVAYQQHGFGEAILIGRKDVIEDLKERLGFKKEKIAIHNASLSKKNDMYIDYLYKRLQRKGFLRRDCQHMVHHDRNVFAACMVASGDADGLVSGLTRPYSTILESIKCVIDVKEDSELFGLSMMTLKDHTLLIADTAVNERPTAQQLANIAMQAAAKARALGLQPRVALLSASDFGCPQRDTSTRIQEAVSILDRSPTDFEYDGDMSVTTALNPELKELYPFCKLSGTANVFVMPGVHSANISSQLLQQLAGGTAVGPILTGLKKPAQIVHMGVSVRDLVNHAALAAFEALQE